MMGYSAMHSEPDSQRMTLLQIPTHADFLIASSSVNGTSSACLKPRALNSKPRKNKFYEMYRRKIPHSFNKLTLNLCIFALQWFLKKMSVVLACEIENFQRN